jgi:hypothetical protein
MLVPIPEARPATPGRTGGHGKVRPPRRRRRLRRRRVQKLDLSTLKTLRILSSVDHDDDLRCIACAIRTFQLHDASSRCSEENSRKPLVSSRTAHEAAVLPFPHDRFERPSANESNTTPGNVAQLLVIGIYQLR